jgi:hypothetical protein
MNNSQLLTLILPVVVPINRSDLENIMMQYELLAVIIRFKHQCSKKNLELGLIGFNSMREAKSGKSRPRCPEKEVSFTFLKQQCKSSPEQERQKSR